MSRLAEFEAKGTEAVRQLRGEKHAAGLPFYLLPHPDLEDHFYMHFPDNSVRLMQGSLANKSMKLIRICDDLEATAILRGEILATQD